MRIIRKMFSKELVKPKRTKEEISDRRKAQRFGSLALRSGLAIPIATEITGAVVGKKVHNKLVDQAEKKLRDISILAGQGDPKAQEFIAKVNKNRAGFINGLETVIRQHPDYVKKVGKAKLAVGAGLGAVAVGSGVYSYKKAQKAQIAEKKYRKELREWKEKKKNEDKA